METGGSINSVLGACNIPVYQLALLSVTSIALLPPEPVLELARYFLYVENQSCANCVCLIHQNTAGFLCRARECEETHHVVQDWGD